MFKYEREHGIVIPEAWTSGNSVPEYWFFHTRQDIRNYLWRSQRQRLSAKRTCQSVLKILREYQFSPPDMYNADEAACLSIHRSSSGKLWLQIKVTSRKRGNLVSLLAVHSIPPSNVFPRVHFKDNDKQGASWNAVYGDAIRMDDCWQIPFARLHGIIYGERAKAGAFNFW